MKGENADKVSSALHNAILRTQLAVLDGAEKKDKDGDKKEADKKEGDKGKDKENEKKKDMEDEKVMEKGFLGKFIGLLLDGLKPALGQ